MPPVNVKNLATGKVHALDAEEARSLVASAPSSWALETPEEAAGATIAAQVKSDYSGPLDKASALAGKGLSAITLGGSDAAFAALGGDVEGYRRQLEANPGYATAGDVGGVALSTLATGGTSLLAKTPAGAASRLGSFLARTAPEAGAATKIGRAALGAGAEGALQSVGQGVSDLALDDDPVTLDRIAGELSSRALLGGGTGALGGAAFGTFEHALGAARKRLAATVEDAAEVGGAIPDDIASLDGKGLRAAREAELASIDAARVPQRASVAQDIEAFREQMKVDQPWVAVATGSKEARVEAAKAAKRAVAAAKRAELAAADEIAAAIDGPLTAQAREARALAEQATAAYDDAVAMSKARSPRWMREGGKTTFKPDKILDNVLDDPKALSGAAGTPAFESRARRVQEALRVQEAAFEKILAHSDELKVIHALDRTGRRAAALEKIPGALEQNRALQSRIESLVSAPASKRLSAIDDAIAQGPAKMTLRQKIGGALAFGAVTSAASGLDLPGSGTIAPILGAAAGSAVAGRLGGALSKSVAASRERSIRAVDALMTGSRIARKIAPPLSSRILAETRFAPDEEPARPTAKPRTLTLADHFDARSNEMARLVVPGPDGKPTVPPHVRQRIAAQLRPIAASGPQGPLLADRMETHAVARILFLDSKRPRPTQIGMTRIPPSEMQMRAWARYIAAADDPGGVEERLADGTVTREDRETMKALYPDRMAEIVRMTVERLGQLRGTLPYQKRLALSIFTGVPVDASTDPRILAQLQSTYTNEPDTEGGTRAPMPRPAFGSVKKPEPTPAQSRAG